jgi:glyoxylase-like metal-dependent hydrolase (beta-lactamase superfamily II)
MKLALAIICLVAGVARAEPSDATARVERLADGVFAIIHDPATDYWSHSNTGVVIGDDGVMVIDATYLPSRARADIALIKKLTPKPVRYLAFTHWHDDHTNGAIAYKQAFPGIAIIAELEMARFIEMTGPAHQHEAMLPDSDERKQIAALEAKPHPTDAERLALRQRKGELAELEAFVMVPPNLRFTDRMTLDLGHRVVELVNRGHANSPDDVTFYLPAERVLFAGDVVVQDPFPYYSQSWPVPWVAVLKQLEQIPITSLVPGHGPVFHDHRYTTLVRSLMEHVIARVTELTRAGASVADMQAAIDGESFRVQWQPWHSGERVFWKRGIDRLIERAWRGVRGQGG